VTEKVDGSIIKIWWHETQNRWRLSTNTRFDAYQTQLFDPLPGDESLTYGDLLDAALLRSDMDVFSRINTDYTYIFELVSPKDQIVVNYPHDGLIHLGMRNNITGEEFKISSNVSMMMLQLQFENLEMRGNCPEKKPRKRLSGIHARRFCSNG
jgi:hypothetical protein